MAKTPTRKTLQKQQLVESYLQTTSKATFNQFVAKKENSIGNIDVGSTSALHLMKHWISLYNNLASMQRTTAKLMKFPTRPSAKFQAIHKKIKALRDAQARYEVESIITLGRNAKSASTSLEQYRELGSGNGEDSDEQESGEQESDEQEQESDEQEHEGDEQEMNHVFNQLRKVAKKRILDGTIPPSDSLHIPRREGLSSVLLNKAANLLCQSKMDCEDMELMKLCLSRNVNLMNSNYREKYAATFDTSTYKEIMEECGKRRKLPPSSITAKIDNLFDNLLEYAFDNNANRISQYFDKKNLLN